MAVSYTHLKIKNAGAIFLGEYSSEPLGDYFAGPNHVLPTNGTAKFFSALSVDDFIKKSSIISYSRNALEKIHNDIETFATAEHLTAHANSCLLYTSYTCTHGYTCFIYKCFKRRTDMAAWNSRGLRGSTLEDYINIDVYKRQV